jgi:quinolinate synthase
MSFNSNNVKDLHKRIRELLRENKAILIAHNYQRPEVQDVADLCGDSLELSIRASQTPAEVIVFCGVHFMAETASILSPDKTVLLPVVSAGCGMADMIDARALRKKKLEMPDAVVVSYVNTTAEVKAESDICCTSANAVQVANSFDPDQKILMTPDRNLALYTRKQTGRDIHCWEGYCSIHNNLSVSQVARVKEAHPEALFLAHPECPPEVLEMADEVRSTSGMLASARQSDRREFIIGTETGLLHPLSKQNPDKVFIPASPDMVCQDMKKTGVQDIVSALEQMEPVIRVPEDIRRRAKKALDRMLAIPGG